MSGNTWMITLKVYFFSLPSITNKYLIYIWNLATQKAINPNKYSALCKAKCFPARASACSVTLALHMCRQTHLLLVLSILTHPSVSQQPGIGCHCACSSLQDLQATTEEGQTLSLRADKLRAPVMNDYCFWLSSLHLPSSGKKTSIFLLLTILPPLLPVLFLGETDLNPLL